MGPAVGAAMASGGSDIAGGLINWAASAQQNKKQRQWSEKMQEKQWQNDLDQWNRENLYNSPSAQMARLTEAGLNKNLMYTQGDVGNANSSPTMSDISGNDVFGLPPLSIPDVVSLYQDIEIKKKNIDLIDKYNEEKELENIERALDGAVKFGSDSIYQEKINQKFRISKYHKSDPSFEHGTIGYDIGTKEANNRKSIAEADTADSLSKWAEDKVNEMRKNNINIDKDDVFDRMLSDMLGKGGVTANGVMKLLTPVILMMLRKGK